ETTDRGFLKTDEHMETNVEGVYALGDIADNWMFKHSANYEAGTVYRNIVTDNSYEVGQIEMPHAVFTSPQIASIGKTEQELNEVGTDYVKSRYDYSDTGMGMALKEEDGYVKLLASEEGEILGCHIIGPEASTLIHEVIVSVQSGSGNISDIKDTIHVHPALSEVVQRTFNQI
ncbi:MAG: dihydrolipoamide dehydrogenase, partial [Nanohaloarchaea archaeon QH_8_44_6]